MVLKVDESDRIAIEPDPTGRSQGAGWGASGRRFSAGIGQHVTTRSGGTLGDYGGFGKGDRRDNPPNALPVRQRTDPIMEDFLRKVSVLSTVAQTSARRPTEETLRKIIANGGITVAAEQAARQKAAEEAARNRVRRSPVPTGAGLPSSDLQQPNKGKKTMALDLGQVMTDLGTAYFKNKYAPKTTTPVLNWPDPFGLPSLFNTGDPAVDDAMAYQLLNKKRRRRRKRLATLSDIRDLAALKSVLGNGEAFKTWIATHPS